MELNQSLGLHQSLAMTTRMQASLRILAMPGGELCTYLDAAQQTNPYLSVRLPAAGAASTDRYDPVAALATPQDSLFAHVDRQIELSFRTAFERRIARGFARSMEPTGWISTEPRAVAAECGCTVDMAAGILAACQEFEPPGLFARSLAECLRIQARDAEMLTPAMRSVLDNLDAVAAGDIAPLAAHENLPEAALRGAFAQLRSFDPKPGLAYSETVAPVQPPDLIVTHGPRGWHVGLNRSALPSIEVLPPPDLDRLTPDERVAARTALGTARWLERTVAQRHATLLKVAAVIVARQSAFLEHGPGNLRPLAMADIAEHLGLHKSTVSRACAYRLVDTPQGLVTLKSLFSRTLGRGASVASQDAALARVKRIVAAEDPASPLSDAAISQLASSSGPALSRRTVAKYRRVLGIASSHARRRRAKARAGP